jgi:hypothetical protein
MKMKLLGIGGKILTNKHPFPQANCLQILVESSSILSLQIFATAEQVRHFKLLTTRVMEREERIGINRGLPTMSFNMRQATCLKD